MNTVVPGSAPESNTAFPSGPVTDFAYRPDIWLNDTGCPGTGTPFFVYFAVSLTHVCSPKSPHPYVEYARDSAAGMLALNVDICELRFDIVVCKPDICDLRFDMVVLSVDMVDCKPDICDLRFDMVVLSVDMVDCKPDICDLSDEIVELAVPSWEVSEFT